MLTVTDNFISSEALCAGTADITRRRVRTVCFAVAGLGQTFINICNTFLLGGSIRGQFYYIVVASGPRANYIVGGERHLDLPHATTTVRNMVIQSCDQTIFLLITTHQVISRLTHITRTHESVIFQIRAKRIMMAVVV